MGTMTNDAPPPSVLQAANLYAELGWHVLPLKPRNKKPIHSKTGTDHAEAATTDPETIHSWFSEHPEWNVGIALGPSRLSVIDVDGPEGHEALLGIERNNDVRFSVELSVFTARGFHLYLPWPKNAERPEKKILGPKLELLAAGQLVVAPPSVHPSGHIYRWWRWPT